MADSLPPPPGLSGNIKFPGRPGAGKTLSLRRRTRSPIEQTAEAVETREKINSIVAATRAPWGESQTTLSADKSAELEKALRELEGRLAERERACEELEVKFADKERELAEAEALLAARERVLEASRKAEPSRNTLSDEEKAALEKLKAELERQEESLKEQRNAIKERESFLDESEIKLFEKVQEQQETETELEQRTEDLNTRERRLREKQAEFDPEVAAQLQAEKAKARDEFTE